MKSKLFVLALVLVMALPVFGLAAEVAATENPTQATEAPAQEADMPAQATDDTEPEAAAAQEDTEQSAATAGGRRGRGRKAVSPRAGFADENNDGVCDTCGKTRGQNPDAPGFTDADGDGVCDHMKERSTQRGRMMLRRVRDRIYGMRKGIQHPQRGNYFVDENADGVCDHRDAAPTREGFGPGNRPMGPGRNRK